MSFSEPGHTRKKQRKFLLHLNMIKITGKRYLIATITKNFLILLGYFS